MVTVCGLLDGAEASDPGIQPMRHCCAARQGGTLSPVLAKVVRDELDREPRWRAPTPRARGHRHRCRRRAARCPTWLESALRHCRSTEPSAQPRQMAATQGTLLRMEATGTSRWEMPRRGVSVRETWNTSKSAYGPWRPSNILALVPALPARYFSDMGLRFLAAE